MTARWTSEGLEEGSSEAGLEGLAEEECVLLATSGSRAAQAELVRRHLKGIFGLCLRLLRDRDAAADATQETFFRALQALSTFDRSRSFRAWIAAIAWNHVRDLGRRRRHRQARSLTGEGEEGLDPPDPRREAPYARLEREESAFLVEEGLGKLDPDARALLVLRDMEGHSYEEIAATFGWKLGTVKSRIHRARLALKDVLVALRPSWFTD